MQSEYVLEPFNLDEDSGIRYSPRDLFDRTGRLLLAKGRPISDAIWELLKQREVYTLRTEWHEWDCRIFSERLYRETVARVQKIYREIRLVSGETLGELRQVVEDLLAEIEKHPRLQVNLNQLRSHDNYTYVHSVNVSLLAAIIGRERGLEGNALRQLVLGALLHDIGKLKIDGDIINKKGGLSETEYATMKLHPHFGRDMLADIALPWAVLAPVIQHHERWDGSGYPEGCKREESHTNAQIVALADVFDAVVSDRPYRAGLPPYHAVELIVSGQGRDFSPAVVRDFSKAITVYPRNATVTLSSGEVGVVVGFTPQAPTRPQVQVLFDAAGNPASELIIIDLLKNLTTFVVAVRYDGLAVDHP